MDDDDLHGQLIVSAGSARAELPALPVPILEALHRTVTARQESITLYRRKNRKIELDDIFQLAHLLEQWTASYAVVSRTLSVIATVSSKDRMRGRARYRFRDMEQFKLKFPSLVDEVKGLEVTFSLVLTNSDDRVIDNIDCVVDLNGITPHYMFGQSEVSDLGGSWRWRRGDSPDAEDVTMRISISYSNYVVAKGLALVVDEWYDALDSVRIFKGARRVKFIQTLDPYDHSSVPDYLIRNIPFAAAVIVPGVLHALGLFDANKDLYYTVFIGAGVAMGLGLIVAAFLGAYGKLTTTIATPLINITVGDKKRWLSYLGEVEAREEREKRLGQFLIYGVGSSIVASLIGLFLGLT